MWLVCVSLSHAFRRQVHWTCPEGERQCLTGLLPSVLWCRSKHFPTRVNPIQHRLHVCHLRRVMGLCMFVPVVVCTVSVFMFAHHLHCKLQRQSNAWHGNAGSRGLGTACDYPGGCRETWPPVGVLQLLNLTGWHAPLALAAGVTSLACALLELPVLDPRLHQAHKAESPQAFQIQSAVTHATFVSNHDRVVIYMHTLQNCLSQLAQIVASCALTSFIPSSSLQS